MTDHYQDDIIRSTNPDDWDYAKASDADDFIGNDIDDSEFKDFETCRSPSPELIDELFPKNSKEKSFKRLVDAWERFDMIKT